VSLVALGHSSAPACLGDGIPIRFPESLPDGVELVSECEVKRRLGLASPQPDVQRQLSTTELARAADLDAETLRTLDLYDVLDGEGGQFGFRDLRSAREAKRLLDRGFTIVEIVEATLALRAQGRGLFDTSLSDTPWGEILQHATGRLARHGKGGQGRLPRGSKWRANPIAGGTHEQKLRAGGVGIPALLGNRHLGPIRIRIEHDRPDVHRRYPIDERVMGLRDVGVPVALDVLHQIELPQGPLEVEGL